MGTKVIGGASGKHGRVFNQDGLELCVTEWTLALIATEFDTTNSCSGGKNEMEYGGHTAEGKLSMDLDLAAHPLDNPPNFQVGSKISEIDLFEHSTAGFATSGPVWYLFDVAITSLDLSVPAAGKVTYTFNFKTGDYSTPDQTFSIS